MMTSIHKLDVAIFVMTVVLCGRNFWDYRLYPGGLTRPVRLKAAAILLWVALFLFGIANPSHAFSSGVWHVLVALVAGGVALLLYRVAR
jgi:hypothetical protein